MLDLFIKFILICFALVGAYALFLGLSNNTKAKVLMIFSGLLVLISTIAGYRFLNVELIIVLDLFGTLIMLFALYRDLIRHPDALSRKSQWTVIAATFVVVFLGVVILLDKTS